VSVVSVSISRPLSVEKSMVSITIVGIGSISLGGSIKSLGDGIQTSGGSEGDSVESVSVSVEGISLGLSGHNQASSEKSLDHVGSTPDTE